MIIVYNHIPGNPWFIKPKKSKSGLIQVNDEKTTRAA